MAGERARLTERDHAASDWLRCPLATRDSPSAFIQRFQARRGHLERSLIARLGRCCAVTSRYRQEPWYLHTAMEAPIFGRP